MRTATDAPEAAAGAAIDPVEEPTDEPTAESAAEPTDDATTASSATTTAAARATATARDSDCPGTDESWVARCQRQFADADRRLPNLADGANQAMYDGV